MANFAYDPRNLEDLRGLQVTELFLDMLTEENENFVEFGIGEHQLVLGQVVHSNEFAIDSTNK